jgi:hypothetical protein
MFCFFVNEVLVRIEALIMNTIYELILITVCRKQKNDTHLFRAL